MRIMEQIKNVPNPVLNTLRVSLQEHWICFSYGPHFIGEEAETSIQIEVTCSRSQSYKVGDPDSDSRGPAAAVSHWSVGIDFRKRTFISAGGTHPTFPLIPPKWGRNLN